MALKVYRLDFRFKARALSVEGQDRIIARQRAHRSAAPVKSLRLDRFKTRQRLKQPGGVDPPGGLNARALIGPADDHIAVAGVAGAMIMIAVIVMIVVMIVVVMIVGAMMVMTGVIRVRVKLIIVMAAVGAFMAHAARDRGFTQGAVRTRGPGQQPGLRQAHMNVDGALALLLARGLAFKSVEIPGRARQLGIDQTGGVKRHGKLRLTMNMRAELTALAAAGQILS